MLAATSAWPCASAHDRHRAAGLPPVALHEAHSYAVGEMSPTWIWMQVAIVIFVVIGMVIAITKLA